MAWDCKGAHTAIQDHKLSGHTANGESSTEGLQEKEVDWSKDFLGSSVSYTTF